jgi:parallel beta-helix repeat protein
MSVLKKCIAMGIMLLSPLVCVGLLVGQSQQCPSCPVYNENSQQCFTTIQAAINAASPGDTISLCPMTFNENITIGKALTLKGYHMFSTYIQGNCTTDIIKITASNVKIKDLCVSGCGDNGVIYNGIWINTANNIIENTSILECYRGIQINGANNIIRGNLICTTWDYYEAIAVLGDQNKIYRNNIIRGNTIPRIGLAIQIVGGQENDIYSNSIANHEYAFYSYVGTSNDISSNTIENNDYGIYLDSSSSNSIIANDISNNREGLYLFCGSNNNLIHRNNFIHNGDHHAYIDNRLTQCTGNVWNDPGPCVGNYWELHDCVDSNGDNICDNAYPIPSSNGANDQDSCPLEYQWQTVCGNADGDINGTITLADIYYLICYVYQNCGNPTKPKPLCAGDVNGDGTISYADISILIDYIYYGGPVPSACPCN